MRRLTAASLILALLLGAALAWLAAPAWRRHAALHAIGQADPTVRQRGWAYLLEPSDEGQPPRAMRLLDRITARLETAGDDALLDGTAALRRIDRWTWAHQPHDLILRELLLRAAMPEEGSQRLAVDLLMQCPLDLDPARLLPPFETLMQSETNEVRRSAFQACCAFLGPPRAPMLRQLDIAAEDERLERMRHLALSWTEPGDCGETTPADAPLGVIEASLMRQTAWTPDVASAVLDMLESWQDQPRPAFEYILRESRDPRAGRALEQLAEAGSMAARYALQSRDDAAEQAQARLVALDASQPPARRRLAAWRSDHVPPALLAEILALRPADADGSVYAVALLAERHLPPDDAAAQAEAWIRSFSDDEKRAGALLAALLNTHHELLARAVELEDMPAVRTTQRLALWAMDRPVGAHDPEEFAHRTLHHNTDDFNADTALCMLLAVDAGALRLLTSRPHGDWAESVRRRALLIDRFVPVWHGAAGRPIGGDVRALLLHFDRLDALRMLSQRRIRFNPVTQTYRAVTAAGAASR